MFVLFSGVVTLGNAIDVQPYRNTMETIQLAGKYLRQALEYSVTSYDTIDPSGKFLQVSGTYLFFSSELHPINISFDNS